MLLSKRWRPTIDLTSAERDPLLSTVLEGVPFGILVVDPSGRAEFGNGPLRELLGRREWLGHEWHRSLEEHVVADLLASMRRNRDHRADVVVDGDGVSRRLLDLHAVARHDGVRAFWIVTVVDVTDERSATARLVDQATHDAMTGLYNRSQFLEFVGHALDRRRRDPKGVAAVLFIDVDNLKETNDTQGHDAGDRLLLGVAERISSAVRPADVVARYGGDEFTVLCEDLLEAAEAHHIAERVIAAVNDHAGSPGTVSVGCAIADNPELEPAAVVRWADMDMYRARAAGGGGRSHPRSVARQPAPPPVLTAAAHELRESLTTIIGHAATLRADGDQIRPEARDAAVAAIERHAGRLASTFDGLLDIARLRSSAAAVLGAIDLCAVVADALVTAPAPARVTVRHTLGQAPTLVLGDDHDDLTRLVVNLLTNAYRHGGTVVEVSVQQEPGRVILAVTDDGPGVPDDLVLSLFEPFVRGSETRARPGAGLGLALAAAIAHANGGSLGYQAATPHGACFRLSLSVVRDEPEVRSVVAS